MKRVQSEEFIHVALDAQIDTFFIFEPSTGKAIRWNRAFREIVGYSDEEIAHLPAPNSYYSPEDLERIGGFVETLLREGVGTIEADLICKDGHTVPTEYRVAVVNNAEGSPQYLVSIGRDITEQRKSTQKLKESEERLRYTLDATEDGIWDWNLETGIAYWSPRSYSMLGYEPGEFTVTYDTWIGLLHPDDVERCVAEIEKAFQGEPFDAELRCRKKDGSWLWLHGRGKCVERDEDGKPRRIIGTSSDLTLRRQTLMSLEASRSKWRAICQNVPDYVMLLRRDGTIDFINRPYPGFTREQLVGTSLLNYMEPEVRETRAQQFEQVWTTGEPVQVEAEYPLPAGEKRLFKIHIGPVWESGKIRGLIHNSVDITEQKRAEEALREAMQTSQDIVTRILHGLFIYRYEPPDRLILLSGNPAAEALTGIRVRDWIGKEFNEIWPQAKEDGITNAYLGVAKSGEMLDEENIHYQDRRLAGAFRTRVFQLPESRLAVAFENITERKKAEEEIRKFKVIFDNANFGGVISSPKGELEYINSYYADVHGYEPEELLGKPYSVLHTEKQLIEVNQIHSSLLRAGAYSTREVWHVHRDGTEFPMLMSGVVIKDQADAPAYIASTAIDFTENKKMEERLRQMEKMEAIGHLAGGIAHDFNNILAGIIGYADMCHELVPTGSRVEKHLQKILDAGDRAKSLVNQILSFSRQSAETTTPLHVRPIVKEAVNLLRASLPSTISIRCDLQMDTKPVLADPTKIHEIVMNLATNAAHAMNERGLLDIRCEEVHLTAALQGRAGKILPGFYSVISVKDTGSGIEEDLINRIFDPYFTTKEMGEGTGMGLAVVFGIVQSYGGDIVVNSKINEGSTFKVYLPNTDREAYETIAPEHSVPGGKERIMFVDDEPMLVEMGHDLLETLGYAVTSFTDPVEALQTFDASPNDFDLIITDQTMPKIPGDELCDEILSRRPDLPIILCTGYSKIMNRETALKKGVKAFIMKPLRRKEIASTIRNVLDGGSQIS